MIGCRTATRRQIASDTPGIMTELAPSAQSALRGHFDPITKVLMDQWQYGHGQGVSRTPP